MNLTNFLKQTDAVSAQYSASQLISFIHDTARILPEQERDGFLERLKAVGKETEKTGDKEKESNRTFNERYKLVKNSLKRIDSQEIAVCSTLNEEYDDWYNSSVEEFYYSDPNGISDMLEEACDFVHICMDRERYREGFEIGNQMFSMEILCDSEYGDEELSLEDMVYHDLLDYDLEQVILDTAYCAYHGMPLKERPEALYQVIVNAGDNKITLEAIMQHGDEELTDFQDFLPLWIDCLGKRAEGDADQLIAEAVGLLNDVSASEKYAEKYVSIHPGLYLNLLENEKYANVDEIISIGIEGIKRIPKKYTMRSRVALKTAEYMKTAKPFSPLLEKCYFAAYESDTCALNYLRALLNGYGEEKKREELRRVFMSFSSGKGGDSYGMFESGDSGSERRVNKPNDNMILLLRFLDGQFADVLSKGLGKSEALGWSGTFMKQGIALFLLYLYEGRWSGRGIDTMADIAKGAMHFSEEEYRKGTCGFDNSKETDLFAGLFFEWKSMVEMDPDVRIRAIKRIEDLLEKRTEGIMSANRRNYYGECAAYIAALGEVKESLGEIGAKQRMMTDYKDRYTRRNAFRAAMRDYGWIDVKRK